MEKNSYIDVTSMVDCLLVSEIIRKIGRFKLDIILFLTIQDMYNHLKDQAILNYVQLDKQNDFK
ncbi:unnamed protein product [Paramecium pentaurelia]|uniref:Uncharacterized protein n=1 Tax=Paramecium pentaurelia TaxID=43138 RepID=A0A8S1UM00_9CILI|nr:unnamed protein product [Paramecium pentaurelia]